MRSISPSTFGIARNTLAEACFDLVDTWGEATQYYWLTAQFNSSTPPLLHSSRLILLSGVIPALQELLERLDESSVDAISAIKTGRKCLRDYTQGFQRSHRRTTPDNSIEAVFRTILNQEIDQEGRQFYLRQISEQVSHSYIIDCLLSSAELRALVRV